MCLCIIVGCSSQVRSGQLPGGSQPAKSTQSNPCPVLFQNHHVAVAESAVIGYPHEIKGEGAYVFVVLKKDSGYTQESLAAELQELISKKIAKYAAPDYVQVTHRLPKTRSGKIMRRVLRKIVEDKASELGDLTTLDDHEVVQQIIEGHKHLVEQQKSH